MPLNLVQDEPFQWEGVDYPEMGKLLDRGMPSGTMHCYVSSAFLDGILPYLKLERVVMLRRYEEEFDADKVEQTLQLPYTKLLAFPDDVLVLGTTPEHAWVLYVDQDVSDCCAGRVRLDEVSAAEAFETYLTSTTLPVAMELPVDRLTGWVTT